MQLQGCSREVRRGNELRGVPAGDPGAPREAEERLVQRSRRQLDARQKGVEMKGNGRVTEALNDLLTLELTVIKQYFLHSKLCENWGYLRLAKRLRDVAFEEMKDAERIIDRILFLEGVPNMQHLGAVTIGESVPEQLQIQLEGERQALKVLADGIKVSLEEGDDASREFFAGSLLDEEEHADWLETELSLIGQVGEANYLAQQIHD